MRARILVVFVVFALMLLPVTFAFGLFNSNTSQTSSTPQTSTTEVPVSTGIVSPSPQVVVTNLPSPNASSKEITVPYLRSSAAAAYSPTSYTPSSDVFLVNPPSSSSSAANPQAVSFFTQILGLTESGAGGYIPPDVQVAVGPAHVVEVVNIAGEIWSKQGASVKTFTLSSFFGTGSNSITDPKILYDAISQRWFATLLDETTSTVHLAVSTSSDPTGSWFIYVMPFAGPCPDQPILGVNDDKVVISVNDYTACSGSVTFKGAEYIVINKSQLVNGAAVSFDDFGVIGTQFSVHPVQSLSPTSTLYMVSDGYGGVSTLWVYAITGAPPNSVSISGSAVSISNANIPPGGIQPGTSSTVNTNDARVLDAAWSNGVIWLSFNDACLPPGDSTVRSCLRLIQIVPSILAVVQDFDVAAANTYFFYPALRIDGLGNLDVVFGFSSSTSYPSMAITGQATGDAPGTVQNPSYFVFGSPASDTTGRYGDYFGAAVDPSDTSIVWTAGEYGTQSCFIFCSYHWGTSIVSMKITGPPTVTQPITCTVANSGPAGTMTLSGAGTNPVTLPCDGNPHNITANPSSTITVTVPFDGTNTRYRFAGTSATVTVNTCASGTCTGAGITAYYQLQNTYQGTPQTPAAWDAALSIPVTGTQVGSSGKTGCTITTANGGGAAGCTSWFDYNTGVTVTSPVSVSGTEQWTQSGGNTFTQTTGGSTNNVRYLDQFAITFAASPPGTGVTSPSGTNVFETYGPLSISATPNTGYGFSIWSSNVGGITFASAGSASTTATIHASGTITATFTGIVTPKLDGSVSAGTNLGTTISVSLTTKCFPDVIIVLIGEDTGRATATAATPTSTGLTFTLRSSLQGGAVRTWEYYAITSGPLTSQTVTEVMSQATAYTLTSFGVCGANTASPFDTSSSLPKTVGGFWGTSHSDTVTTSNANDFIFGFDASQGNPSYTPLNGYTSVLTQEVPSWMASSAEYKVVSTTQSHTTLGFTLSVGEYGAQIIDAIVAGSQATVTEPISLTINEAGGPAAVFTVNGCGATPSTITGDGVSHLVTIQPSCSFTLGYTSSGTTRYGFITGGVFSSVSPSQTSCSSGTCSGVSLGYDLQQKLTVVGGYGVSYSKSSETNDGWYKYGDTLTVSSNGIGTRSAGSGPRVSSWQIDGGSMTSVATLGQVTTSTIAMTAAQTVTFGSATQFQLTFLTSGSGTASATTSPTITGDTGWYDAGTSVAISASPSSGNSFASWTGTGTGSYTGTNNPTTVVMNAPIAETATFQPTKSGSLSLDGSVSAGTNLGTMVSVSLTTKCFPDVILILLGENSVRAAATATAPTSTGLTFTLRDSLQSGTMRTWEYYAIASSPLTSQAITEVMSQQTAYTLTAFAVCGANTAAPFDASSSLPKTIGGLSGTTHSTTVTTSNANDLILDFDASQGNPTYTPLNGYSSILTQEVSSWMASSTEYKVVSTTQSGTSLGFTLSVGQSGSQIVDAIVAAPAQPSVAVSIVGKSAGQTGSTNPLVLSLNVGRASLYGSLTVQYPVRAYEAVKNPNVAEAKD